MTAPASSGQRQLIAYAQELGGAYELLQVHNELLPVPLNTVDLRQESHHVANVTVLVAGFPALPGLLEEPSNLQSLLRTLNEHLAVAVEQVEGCQGVIEHFAAGSLTATFGARGELSAASDLALAAALAVVGANQRLNREAGLGHQLDVGVGLAAGPAIAGHLGAPYRWEMGMLGECLNVAAHLAAKARPLEVLLDEEAYRAVAESVRARYVGPTSLRGRSGNISTYSIKPVE